MRRMFFGLATLLLLPACGTSTSHSVLCDGEGDTLILAAQAVPGATMLPCVENYPAGWSDGGFRAKTGSVTFWLDSDRAGLHAVEVELSDGCDTAAAAELDPDPESGAQRFERRLAPEPALTGRRFFTFEGGCVTLRYAFAGGAGVDLLDEAEASLGLVPRAALVTLLQDRRDLVLCGAEAPPCD